MRTFEAIIFDLFDTLIDFDVNAYRSAQHAYMDGMGLDGTQFIDKWNKSSQKALNGEFVSVKEWYSTLLKQMSDTGSIDVESMLTNEREALDKACKTIPGIHEFLSELQVSGYLLAVISNSSCIGTELLSLKGIGKFFHETLFSYVEKVGKPNPEIYELACDRLGIETEKAAYVSDGDKNELEGARRAGLYPIRFDPTCQFYDAKIPPGIPEFKTIDALKEFLI